MDVLQIARQRRAALMQEIERLDVWIASGGKSESAEDGELLHFPEQPRTIQQFSATFARK